MTVLPFCFLQVCNKRKHFWTKTHWSQLGLAVGPGWPLFRQVSAVLEIVLESIDAVYEGFSGPEKTNSCRHPLKTHAECFSCGTDPSCAFVWCQVPFATSAWVMAVSWVAGPRSSPSTGTRTSCWRCAAVVFTRFQSTRCIAWPNRGTPVTVNVALKVQSFYAIPLSGDVSK